MRRVLRPAVPRFLALLLALSACSQQAPAKSYDLVVHVESDPGQPVAEVKLLHAGQELGATGLDGRVVIRATGNEGERVDLDVACPDDYRSPESPLRVTLRRGTGRPEYFAACTPKARKLVVAARLEHGGGLPIHYLGREVARTDASGVAHCVIEGETGQTVELTVDTSERPTLRPKSPTARFLIERRDELVVMEQGFQSSARPVVRTQRPSGPVRIR